MITPKRKSAIEEAAEELFRQKLEEMKNVFQDDDPDQENYNPSETGLNAADTKDLLSVLEYVSQVNMEHISTLEDAKVIFEAVSMIISQAMEIFFCRCNKARLLEECRRVNNYTLACLHLEVAERAVEETFAELEERYGDDQDDEPFDTDDLDEDC